MTSVSIFKHWLRAPFLICAAGCFMFVSAQNSTTPSQSAPDNTKTNKTDVAKPTAGQQKENKADLETTQKIRKLIESDKSLSTYAKNIKVVTQSGDVTLSGPVGTEDEKKSVEAKAVQIAGKEHVRNQIQITPPKASGQKK